MRIRLFIVALVMASLACSLPAFSSPTPVGIDQLYESATQTAAASGASMPVVTETIVPVVSPTSTLDPGEPTGKIAFTCQVYKIQASDQICVMNADGSDYHRITTENGIRHFYPSFAPDGQSVVYSAFRDENIFEIYEITLDGVATRLTDRLGVLTAPEISPDGNWITFTHWSSISKDHAIWVMDRDGSNPHQVTPKGWDPTWSPDGQKILFASDMNGTVQLYIVNLDGSGLTPVTVSMSGLRGRTDWSDSGEWLVTYAGTPWHRELYMLRPDGSDTHRITPEGGNSQGPSFSPDGRWVTFTAYFDRYEDIHGCEIYIMRTDGTDLRRLTSNDYCDWQPRWGP